MAARYKTTTLNGKPILSHRKVWILNYGPIPKGHHIHHKNGDRFNNRIENLGIMSAAEHCAHHSRGRRPWNKGLKYGETEAYKKGNRRRNENYAKVCEKTYSLWKSGLTQAEVARVCGISRRHVCDRLRSHRINCGIQAEDG